MEHRTRIAHRGSAVLIAVWCLLVGCQREASDWQAAKAAGTIAAFREFAVKHPEGVHAPLVDNEIFLLQPREEQSRLLQERLTAIADGTVEPFAIPDVPAGKAIYADAQGVQFSGTHAAGGYTLSLTGLAVPGGGNVYLDSTGNSGRALAGAVQLGVGKYRVDKNLKEFERRPIKASMTFAESGPGIVVSTERPDDKITMGQPTGSTVPGSSEFIVPSGSGSIFRIVGRIEGLAVDSVIIGDSEVALYLGLLENKGLVYLYGRGTVILKDGGEKPLPPAIL